MRLISLRIDEEILAHCEELLLEINSARGKRRRLTISDLLRQALKLGLERNDKLRAALIAPPPMLTEAHRAAHAAASARRRPGSRPAPRRSDAKLRSSRGSPPRPPDPELHAQLRAVCRARAITQPLFTQRLCSLEPGIRRADAGLFFTAGLVQDPRLPDAVRAFLRSLGPDERQLP